MLDIGQELGRVLNRRLDARQRILHKMLAAPEDAGGSQDAAENAGHGSYRERWILDGMPVLDAERHAGRWVVRSSYLLTLISIDYSLALSAIGTLPRACLDVDIF